MFWLLAVLGSNFHAKSGICFCLPEHITGTEKHGHLGYYKDSTETLQTELDNEYKLQPFCHVCQIKVQDWFMSAGPQLKPISTKWHA